MREQRVHDPPYRPRVDPAAPRAEEQRRAAARPAQRRPALRQPALDGPQRGQADRDGPLLRRPCRAPAGPGGPGRRRRGRARTARRPGCRSRRGPRAPPGPGLPCGLSSSAASPATCSSASASSRRSTPGSVRPGARRGQQGARVGRRRSPSRAAQAVKARAAAARRASVVRAIPRVAWPASQLRSSSRSSPAGESRPIRRACSNSVVDVTAVGADRVLGQVPLGAQVPGEGLQRVGEGGREGVVPDGYRRPPPRLVAHGRHRDP